MLWDLRGSVKRWFPRAKRMDRDQVRFVFQMMDFVSKMMDFVFKMMILDHATWRLPPRESLLSQGDTRVHGGSGGEGHRRD